MGMTCGTALLSNMMAAVQAWQPLRPWPEPDAGIPAQVHPGARYISLQLFKLLLPVFLVLQCPSKEKWPTVLRSEDDWLHGPQVTEAPAPVATAASPQPALSLTQRPDSSSSSRVL